MGEIPYIQIKLNKREQLILVTNSEVKDILKREKIGQKSSRMATLYALGSIGLQSSVVFLREIMSNLLNRFSISQLSNLSISATLKKYSPKLNLSPTIKSLINFVLKNKKHFSILDNNLKKESRWMANALKLAEKNEDSPTSTNFTMIYLHRNGEIRILSHDYQDIKDWENFDWKNDRENLLQKSSSLTWSELKYLLDCKIEDNKKNSYWTIKILQGAKKVASVVYPVFSFLIGQVLVYFIFPSAVAFTQILMDDIIPPFADISVQNSIKVLNLYYQYKYAPGNSDELLESL